MIKETKQPTFAQPSILKDEPASELDCSGDSKPRRISAKAGRQQVGGYLLPERQKVKVSGHYNEKRPWRGLAPGSGIAYRPNRPKSGQW
jgi:hypothetical protein